MTTSILSSSAKFGVSHQFLKCAALSTTLVSALAVAPISSAQLSPKPVIRPFPNAVYTAKFVCGFQQGISRPQVNSGLGAAPPLPTRVQPNYPDFQPGNYSSALNVFNPTRNRLRGIRVFAITEDLQNPQQVDIVNLAPLRSAQIGCSDIASTIGSFYSSGLADGELVEGFLYISRIVDDLQVQAVYGYSSVTAFQQFQGDAPGGAGGGAGGAGLGASVDIETIHPKIMRTPQNPFPVQSLRRLVDAACIHKPA